MAADTAFVVDLFAGVGGVTARRMFGGVGVYADGVMFALVGFGEIFIKTDDAMREELAVLGSSPFVYMFEKGNRAGEAVEMGYWRLPEAALDDPDEAAAWGRKALAVAQAKRAEKGRKRTSSKSKRRESPQ